MATRGDRIVIDDGLLSIKSHDTLSMWSWKITWQTEIMSPLPKSLWSTIFFGGMVTHLDGLLPIKLRDPLIMRSCKITWLTKALISPYPSVYRHQTRQDGNSRGWAPTHKITCPFDYVVLQKHVTNENHYLPTTSGSIATRLGRILSYLEQLPLIKLLNPMFIWFCKIKWQIKIISHQQTWRRRTFGDVPLGTPIM